MPSPNGDGDKRYSYSADKSTDSSTYAEMDELTRRRLLAVGGASALSSIVAGCGGDGDQPDATTTVEVDTTAGGGGAEDDMDTETTVVEEGGDTTIRSVVRWNWPADETTMNYNAPANNPGGYSQAFFFTPMTAYSKQDQRYYPVLLKELPTYDRCFQIHTFKQNFTWWDGFEHNAWDQVYGHQAQAYACCGGPDEVSWNAQIVEGTDFAYKENKGAAYAPDLAAGNAMKGIRWRRDIFKPIFEKFKDAESQDEIDAALKDFQNIDLTVDDVQDHYGGNSLFMPVEATADRLTMEVYEDHPFADNTSIDRWEIRLAPKRQTELQLINNNEVDVGDTDFSNLSDPPSELKTQLSASADTGMALGFNWRRSVPGDRAFRQAMAYLLPMNNISLAAERSGVASKPIDFQAGAAPRRVAERGSPDGFIDSLIDYGVGAQPDKAKQKLQSAGYSKNNGSWVDPDGNNIELRIISQSISENANVGAAVSGLLNDFGIPNNFSLLESGTFRDTFHFREGNHEYDMVLTGANVARGISTLIGENSVLALDAEHGWDVSQIGDCESASTPPKPMKRDTFEENDEGQPITPRYGVPLTEEGMPPEIPTEIGRDNLNGETYRPDLARISWWSSFRHPKKKIREWNSQYMWWVNFYMPEIQFYSRRTNIWMDEENYTLTESPASDTMGDSGNWYLSREDYHPHNLGELTSK